MTVHRPPSGASAVVIGGVGVCMDPHTGVWQIVCDTCGRWRRGSWRGDLGIVEPREIGVRSPDNTYAGLGDHHHMCAVCWRKRDFLRSAQRGLPAAGSVWWSPDQACRRIIRIHAVEGMTIIHEWLFSPEIATLPGASLARPIIEERRFIPAEHFHDLFKPPEEVVTNDELRLNRRWACIEDPSLVAIIRDATEAEVFLAEPFEAPNSGVAHEKFFVTFFVNHFFPLFTLARPTAWERLDTPMV